MVGAWAGVFRSKTARLREHGRVDWAAFCDVLSVCTDCMRGTASRHGVH